MIPPTPQAVQTTLVQFTLYDLVTGQIKAIGSAQESQLPNMVSETVGYVRGHHDAHNRRINPETQQAEFWQPPKPDDDHEWSEEAQKWEIPLTTLARQAAVRGAQERIDKLEYQQARAMREDFLGIGDANEIRQRLEDIDAEIVTLRAIINEPE